MSTPTACSSSTSRCTHRSPCRRSDYLLGYCAAGIGHGRFVSLAAPGDSVEEEGHDVLLLAFRPVAVVDGAQFEDFFPLDLRRRHDRAFLDELKIEWLTPGPLSDAIHSIAFGWMPDWQRDGRNVEIAHPLPPVPLSLNAGLANLVASLSGYTPEQSAWMTPGTLSELSRAVDALPAGALSVIDETLSYFGYGLALVPLERDKSSREVWRDVLEGAGERPGGDQDGTL